MAVIHFSKAFDLVPSDISLVNLKESVMDIGIVRSIGEFLLN